MCFYKHINMALEITDTRYGKAKKTLYDIIILILAKEYPLTIGEVTKRLRTEFKISVTFQAVSKSLKILVERGVLAIKDKKFLLEKNYILEQKRLTDQFLRNYFASERENKSINNLSKDEEHTTYYFDNLIQLDKFWGEIIMDWARNLKPSDEHSYFFRGPHCWYPLGHAGVESDFLNELKDCKVQCYYMTLNNTLLDKWLVNCYTDHGAKYLIESQSSKDLASTAISVFGDLIIQMEYPPELYREMDDYYQKATSFTTMRLSRIAKLLKQKTKIKLTVMHNKMLASSLKSDILSHFKYTLRSKNE
jgi:hypothetical protein